MLLNRDQFSLINTVVINYKFSKYIDNRNIFNNNYRYFSDSNPVLISSPSELAGMTLEARLISYDWQNQFDEFQEATRSGSFKPLCWGAKNHVIPVSTYTKFLRTVLLGSSFIEAK